MTMRRSACDSSAMFYRSDNLDDWQTFMNVPAKIDVTTYSLDGDTVGWVARIGCNTWLAYRKPEAVELGEPLELLNDGELVGVYPDESGARAAVKIAVAARAA